MNATAFDPGVSYDVFTKVTDFTGMINHFDFLRGHTLIDALPKSADEQTRAKRVGDLHWFDDMHYRVVPAKRPARED